MAKTTFLSAGVYTREFDLSFIPAPIPPVGACVIGPTVRGPVLMPTKVASYSEYLRWYGDVFESGSSADDEQSYKYLTTYAVQEYLRWGDVVTVMRIDGSASTPAFSNVISSGAFSQSKFDGFARSEASMSFQLETIGDGSTLNTLTDSVVYPVGSIEVTSADLADTGSGVITFSVEDGLGFGTQTVTIQTSDYTVGDSGSSAEAIAQRINTATDDLFATINAETASKIDIEYISSYYANKNVTIALADGLTASLDATNITGGTALEALIYGSNEFDTSYISDPSTNAISTGNRFNIKWEIANIDETRGTFDLYIRRGDDTDTRKVVLEQFSGITLDPNEPNYIVKVIGDQNAELVADAAAVTTIQMKGNYPNRSRFVRVSNVFKTTMNYIRNTPSGYKVEYTSSLPAENWGVFGGGTDDPDFSKRDMYTNINAQNTQGYCLTNEASGGYNAYLDAIDILSNKDQYDYDLLFIPGVVDTLHPAIVTRAITMVEDRGDAFLVIDPVPYNQSAGAAMNAANGRNTNYAAYYWPWVQVADADLGGNYWVPASTQVAGVFAFNDYVSEKWFAPAGLNRGGLDMVVQAERTLTINDRDALYSKNVNPIATFPQNGPVVWGQKTLQKKRSALDRINVRRLLIAAKRHVANTSKYLVFEQNTAETRANFINITKPFFDEAVQKQGIYDYRIIIDERNNTPDVIDRNEMRAQIYLKPAKTAEFIIVDFLVLPTGAAFPIDNDQ